MSTIPFTLGSDRAKQVIPSNTASNFTTPLNQPIDLASLDYELCLLSIKAWYSTKNVVGKTLVYSSDDGSSWTTVDIPDGLYPVQDINALLLASLKENSLVDTDDTPGIEILGNANTNRVDIVINNFSTFDFQVDLSATDNLSSYFGFTEKIVSASESGTLKPNLNPADLWKVHCNIVQEGFDGNTMSKVIASFIPNTTPHSSFIYTPQHLSFHRVDTTRFTSINIRITDENDNDLDFGDEETIVELRMRPL